MKSEQKFDQQVQQHLTNPEWAAGDWDMPSEHVWENIESSLTSKNRRRSVFWWLLFGLLLIPVISMLVIWSLDSTRHQDGSDKQPQDMSTGLIVTSTPEPEQWNSGGIESDVDETPEYMPESESVSPVQPLTEKVTIPHRQHAGSTHETKAINSRNPENSSEKAPMSNTPEGLTLNVRIPNAAVSMQNSSVSEIVVRSEIHNFPALQSPDLLPLTTHRILPHPVSTPFITRPAQHTWSLTAALTPSLSSRRIVVPNAQPRVRRQLLLQQEDPAAQLGLALSAIRDLGTRWSIGFGLEYGRYLLNSTTLHQVRYTRAGETLNTRGNFENRFNLNINTSYGELSTDVILERSSDAQIPEHQFIDLSLQTRQTMQVLQFPVSVRYVIPLRHVMICAHGGVSANFLLENVLEFRAIQSLDTDIMLARGLRRAQLSGSRDFAWGYQFGLCLEVPVDRRLSIQMEPTFSGYLQSVYRNQQVVVYPVLMDIHVGVRYRL